MRTATYIAMAALALAGIGCGGDDVGGSDEAPHERATRLLSESDEWRTATVHLSVDRDEIRWECVPHSQPNNYTCTAYGPGTSKLVWDDVRIDGDDVFVTEPYDG